MKCRAANSIRTCNLYVQGDKEARIGLPVSPMCNRANMNMPRAQIGFINIFLKVSIAATLAAALVGICWSH